MRIIFTSPNSYEEQLNNYSSNKTCPNCKLDYNNFRRTGRFGCAMCYKTFQPELKEIFRRIQAGDKQQGRPYAKARKEKGDELV